jgi:hypothetical protein
MVLKLIWEKNVNGVTLPLKNKNRLRYHGNGVGGRLLNIINII